MKQFRMIKCPKQCGGRLLYRPGKWGAFYQCENNPRCKGRMSVEEAYLSEQGHVTAIEKQNKEIQRATQAIANMRRSNA